jgi:uncharacterized membrane protein YuzA (DUF378 family)
MIPAVIRTDWIFNLALLLVIVGALNWLLVGLFNWDLVAAITFARQPKADNKPAARVVYSLVGAAAVVLVVLLMARK